MSPPLVASWATLGGGPLYTIPFFWEVNGVFGGTLTFGLFVFRFLKPCPVP